MLSLAVDYTPRHTTAPLCYVEFNYAIHRSHRKSGAADFVPTKEKYLNKAAYHIP